MTDRLWRYVFNGDIKVLCTQNPINLPDNHALVYKHQKQYSVFHHRFGTGLAED